MGFKNFFDNVAGNISDKFYEVKYSDNSTSSGLGKITSNIVTRQVVIDKNIRQEARKKIEDIADELNSDVGQFVRNTNNLMDSIENIKDSQLDMCNPTQSIKIINRSFSIVSIKDLEPSDHLYTQGVGYTHHGIYVGNNKVVHFALNENREYIEIREDTLEAFANGRNIMRKTNNESPIKYSSNEVVCRAYSKIGNEGYNLLFNNCENFARWCRHGGEE